MLKYSFVVPVYNEAEVVDDFYKEFARVLDTLKESLEVLFVTGGNTDSTLDILKQIARNDKRVKIINLSHRFDYQAALTAGFDYSTGDAVISLDGDLQHPPEVIPVLIDTWKKGFDIVYTIRKEASGENFFKNAGSKFFYLLLKLMTRIDFEKNCADFRLMSRKAVDAFKKFPETQRYIPGIVSILGFKKTGVAYTSSLRPKGKTKFTFSRMASLAVNGILSFSITPIRVIIIVGLVMTFLSFTYLASIVVWSLAHPGASTGWASILSTILLLSSLHIFTLGVIGEYVARIYEEVKRRPLYIIEDLIGF